MPDRALRGYVIPARESLSQCFSDVRRRLRTYGFLFHLFLSHKILRLVSMPAVLNFESTPNIDDGTVQAWHYFRSEGFTGCLCLPIFVIGLLECMFCWT
jgi:hypothetical protein